MMAGATAMMLRKWRLSCCAAMMLAFPVDGSGQTERPPEQDQFAPFRIVQERNIFDPNRSARVVRQEPRREEARPRTESIALVGTMSYEKGDLAFFNGSRPEYKKAAKASESIAGYQIVRIEPDKVILEVEGRELEVPVGGGLQRTGDGEWTISGTVARASRSESSSTSGASSPGAASGSSEAEDEVLKRLMQKREQENNR